MKKIVKSEDLKAYRPELNTAPRVYYRHLYHYICSLITGSVVFEEADECAENAKIIVIDCYGKIVDSAFADNYGDSRIDRFDTVKGACLVEVEFGGYDKNVVETGSYDRMGLGTLFLRPL